MPFCTEDMALAKNLYAFEKYSSCKPEVDSETSVSCCR